MLVISNILDRYSVLYRGDGNKNYDKIIAQKYIICKQHVAIFLSYLKLEQ